MSAGRLAKACQGFPTGSLQGPLQVPYMFLTGFLHFPTGCPRDLEAGPQRLGNDIPKPLGCFLQCPYLFFRAFVYACKACCLLQWPFHWLACPRGLRAGFQMKVWGQLPRDFPKISQRALTAFLCSSPANPSGLPPNA